MNIAVSRSRPYANVVRLNPMPEGENPDRGNAEEGMDGAEMSKRFEAAEGEIYLPADATTELEPR